MRDTPALRSWLFVSSIDDAAAAAALKACPDVVILEFEDFTPPERRPEGRRRLPELTEAFRAAGIEVAVRINPIFDPDGPLDLAAALSAGIRRIAFPKTRGPQDVHLVAKAIEDFDAQAEISSVYRLIPNIETAAALRQSYEIATAHPAVEACLVASEDMAADLGADRDRSGLALRHVRERFLVDCVAAGVAAIDCPYTWRDLDGLAAEVSFAKTLGYKAKSAVDANHIPAIHTALTPSATEIETAGRVVAAFDAARALGQDRAFLDGHALEVPTYKNAQALLMRVDVFRSKKD